MSKIASGFRNLGFFAERMIKGPSSLGNIGSWPWGWFLSTFFQLNPIIGRSFMDKVRSRIQLWRMVAGLEVWQLDSGRSKDTDNGLQSISVCPSAKALKIDSKITVWNLYSNERFFHFLPIKKCRFLSIRKIRHKLVGSTSTQQAWKNSIFLRSLNLKFFFTFWASLSSFLPGSHIERQEAFNIRSSFFFSFHILWKVVEWECAIWDGFLEEEQMRHSLSNVSTSKRL